MHLIKQGRILTPTVTPVEKGDTCLPEPLISMFDQGAVGISDRELVAYSECLKKTSHIVNRMVRITHFLLTRKLFLYIIPSTIIMKEIFSITMLR